MWRGTSVLDGRTLWERREPFGTTDEAARLGDGVLIDRGSAIVFVDAATGATARTFDKPGSRDFYAIDVNGGALLGAGNRLHRLDLRGASTWTIDLSGDSQWSLIVGDCLVFTRWEGAGDKQIDVWRAIAPLDGHTLWERREPYGTTHWLAALGDGVLFDRDSTVEFVDAATGLTRRSIEKRGTDWFSVIAVEDGMLLEAGDTLHLLDRRGGTAWSIDKRGPFVGLVALNAAGTPGRAVRSEGFVRFSAICKAPAGPVPRDTWIVKTL